MSSLSVDNFISCSGIGRISKGFKLKIRDYVRNYLNFWISKISSVVKVSNVNNFNIETLILVYESQNKNITPIYHSMKIKDVRFEFYFSRYEFDDEITLVSEEYNVNLGDLYKNIIQKCCEMSLLKYLSKTKMLLNVGSKKTLTSSDFDLVEKLFSGTQVNIYAL